jgi:hypothetical protein
MSDYHKARDKGYDLAEDFIRAMEAAVPPGLDPYRRARWLDDAYGAACASINYEQRAAFAATGAAFAERNVA